MPSKIQIITNEHQEELKEHGTYEFPVLVSDEALSRFYTSSFQWHWHTEIELTLITEGTMVYQINDQIFYPRAGQALFGNSNTMHTGRMENGRDCRYISITFHPRLLYGYQGSRIASRYTDPLMENAALPAVCFDLSQEWHGEAVGLLEDIIRIDSLRYDTYEMDIQMDLFRFWKLLYLHCRPDREPAHTAGRKNQERIRQMHFHILPDIGAVKRAAVSGAENDSCVNTTLPAIMPERPAQVGREKDNACLTLTVSLSSSRFCRFRSNKFQF